MQCNHHYGVIQALIDQAQRPLLSWAVINALTLQTTPDRCRAEVLVLILKKSSHKDILRYFTVEGVTVWSLDELKAAFHKKDPDQDPTFDDILEDSRQIYANGGIGVALLVIFVDSDSTCTIHVIPFQLKNRLTENDLPSESRWASLLIEMVAAGQVL